MIKNALMVLTGTLLTTTALGNGWDWVVESVIDNSEWSQETLDWFSDASPLNPTDTFLLTNVNPPPREMWCIDSTWEENCEDWSFHMDFWLHNHLNIPLSQPLPSTLPDYPEECPSSCDDLF